MTSATTVAFANTHRNFPAPDASIGGLSIHAPDQATLENVLCGCFDGEQLRHVSTVRMQDLRRVRRDCNFREILSRLDLLVAEGWPLAALARFLHHPLPRDRWSGDLTETVLRAARERDRRVYFLGGEGSAPFDWARRAHYRFPGLQLAGAYAPGPDFRDAEGGRRIVDRVNRSGADVIIALPSVSRGEEFPFRYGAHLEAKLYVNLWAGLPPSWHRRSAWKPYTARYGLQLVPRSPVLLADG